MCKKDQNCMTDDTLSPSTPILHWANRISWYCSLSKMFFWTWRFQHIPTARRTTTGSYGDDMFVVPLLLMLMDADGCWWVESEASEVGEDGIHSVFWSALVFSSRRFTGSPTKWSMWETLWSLSNRTSWFPCCLVWLPCLAWLEWERARPRK